MKAVRLLCFSALLGAMAAAAEPPPSPLQLEFARLDLRDGRTLKNVVVKSYDAASGKVLLLAGGKAMAVPLESIPPPFAEQLKAGAPRSGETVSVPVPPAPPPPPAAANHATPIEKPKPMVMQPTSPAPAPYPARPAIDPAVLAKEIAAHKDVARERAEKYFRYEHQMGSNNISVSRLDLELEEPLPVEGWTGRYRTDGKAFIEFYDSKGNSFQRTTSTFEAITERKPGAAIKVETFSRKN